MNFYKDTGNIFKEAREKAELTQAEVANKAGIHINYYARIERGEPESRGIVLNNIAKALKIAIKLPLWKKLTNLTNLKIFDKVIIC